MRRPRLIDLRLGPALVQDGVHPEQARRRTGLPAFLAAFLVTGAALAALIGLAAQPAHAAGQQGSVTFQRRDYDVHIQTNGDVAVDEHWVVQFSGGPYTKAHLDLYLSHTGGIDFGTVAGATPGSQQVNGATDASGNVLREITWTYPQAQDTTRAFTIPYTIHGAIGLNSTQAWLDWHFLDGNGQTDFTVDSSTVTETLPATASGGGVQVTATYPGQQPQTATPTSTTATASAQNLNSGQPFEVLVVFPRSELDASVQKPSWQQSDSPPTPPTSITGSGGTGGSGSSGGQPGIGGGTTSPAPSIGPGGFGSIFTGLCGSLPCLGIIVLGILSLISRLAWRHSGVGAPMRPYGGWWGGYGYPPYGGYGPGPRAPFFGGGGTPPGGGMGGGGSSGFGGGGGGGGGGTGGGGGGSSGFG